MQKKYLITISILTIFLSISIITFAQQKLFIINKSGITDLEDMQKYMEVIASDSAMRIQMLNLMIWKCEGDENAMMELGITMMQNAEMNNTLTKLIKNDTMIESDIHTDKKMKYDDISDEKIKMESTKTIQKPVFDSTQKK